MSMRNTSSSASDDMDVDGWLESGEHSSGSFFEMDWESKSEYYIWLHPKAAIRTLWRIVWKYVGNDDKIRLMRWNSMEHPRILERQNFKLDDGSNEHAPEVDPFAKLIEWVNVQRKAGKIGLTDEIFRWEGETDEVVHAGGFTGEFRSTKLTDEDKDEIKALKIRRDQYYKQDARAREETVFIVVDNDDPGAGPQIATVTRGISKAFKKEVAKRKKQFTKNPEKANPLTHPVCFCWSRDDEGDFPEYSVAATDAELTDEVKAAFEQEVPNTDKIFAPSNVPMLRENFETHWCHDVVPPWDEIFGAAEEAVKGTSAGEMPTDFNHGANKKDDEDEKPSESKTKEKPVSKPAPKKEEPEEDQDDEEEEQATEGESTPDGTECDACGKLIGDEVFESDPIVCPHCGAEYEFDQEKDEFRLKPKKEEKPKIKMSSRRARE